MIDVSQFAGRLREAIYRAGVKQNALARAIGISQNSLSRYLMGSRNPSRPVLQALARELRVTVEYLVGTSSSAGADDSDRGERSRASEEAVAYIPDAVSLTGLDAEDRRTVLRLMQALRSGHADVRDLVIRQMKMYEQALEARRVQPRKDVNDAS